jgi:cation-transporting P-type ATPase E
VPADSDSATGSLVRAHVFTRFNLILTTLVATALALGAWPVAVLAAGPAAANVVLGVAAGRRADAQLGRLAHTDSPEVTIVRDGGHELVSPDALAAGDVIELEPGAQVVVDGTVLAADGLELDESQVTGAALPVVRRRGDHAWAGSFVTAGRGRVEVRAQGASSGAADAGRHSSSPATSSIGEGLDRLTTGVVGLAAVLALLILVGQRGDGVDSGALRGPAGGLVLLAPTGLVLLSTVAATRTTRRLRENQIALRTPAAADSLAEVDVLCVDKTGTLTEPVLDVARLQLVPPSTVDAALVRQLLGAVAWMDREPDALCAALAQAFPSPRWAPTVSHPFTAGRRVAAVGFAEQGHWLLGAPDVLLGTDDRGPEAQAAARLVDESSWSGQRVLLLAKAHDPLPADALTTLPAATPVALVTFEERISPDAGDVLAELRRQGTEIKVLSGDDARSVAAVAERLKLPGAESPVDGDRLPDPDQAPEDLAAAAEGRTVFGRLGPDQKRALVAALRRRGHRVAMVGDGANDVPALAEADMGITLTSGSPAARATADVILPASELRPLTTLRDEGARLLATVGRLAELFLAETVFVALVLGAAGAAGATMPLLTGHLALVGTLGFAVPAVALALGPTAPAPRDSHRRGFVEQALRFGVPAGGVAATATFASYILAEDTVGTDRAGAGTAAALTLLLLLLWLVYVLLGDRGTTTPGWGPTRPQHTVPLVLGALAALVFAAPPLRDLFDLAVDDALVLGSAVGVAAIAGVALDYAWQISDWGRPADNRQGA